MLSKEFTVVNSAACTPQQQMNNFIAASLKNVDMSDITPMRCSSILKKIKQDMDEVLHGSEPNDQALKVQSPLTQQLILLEAIEIKKVIDTPCFKVHEQALEDIIAHGSMSFARLFDVNSERPAQSNDLDLAL